MGRATWRDERVEPEVVDVPMAAGHRLSALHYPAPAGPSPAVVLFTPYRKEGAWLTYADFATHAGYEVFVVDVRATGGSGGSFEGSLSSAEVDDAVEFLEWVAGQPFSDGQTALIGSSYSGLIQYLVAARRPPSLRCIAPSIAPLDHYRDMTHRGGIPSSPAWYASTYGGSGQLDTIRRGLLQGIDDRTDAFDGPAARSRSAGPGILRRVGVPTLCLGGMYDLFASATITAHEQLECPKRLVFGNWGHETEKSEVETTELIRWLAYWLRSEGTDPTAEPSIVAHRAGDRTWHHLRSWSSERDQVRRTTITHVDQTIPVVTSLEVVPPPLSTPMSDPTIDALIDSGMRIWGEGWTTRDLTGGPYEIRGTCGLALDLRTSHCEDLDIHARLSLVRSDGSVEQVAESRLRASHRQHDVLRSRTNEHGELIEPFRPHERLTPIQAGAATRLGMAFSPIWLRIDEGEQLQLGLTLVRADGVNRPAVVDLLPTSELSLAIADSEWSRG